MMLSNFNYPLIGLTGKARSGKNTAGDMLAGMFTIPMVQYALADEIRAYALELDPLVPSNSGMPMRLSDALSMFGGWEGIKEQPEVSWEVRGILQRLGTDVGRAIAGEDVWVRLLEKRVESDRLCSHTPHKGKYGVIVTDVRFANEAQWIRTNGGVVIRLARDEEVLSDHPSENGVPLTLVDRTVDNNGSLDYLHRGLLDSLSGLPIPAIAEYLK